MISHLTLQAGYYAGTASEDSLAQPRFPCVAGITAVSGQYVFVNLWGRPHGRPLAYPAVYDLVCRLRRQTGIDFDPHWYRHTTATRLLREGVAIEVVSAVLGHASITTTLAVYGHLTSEDARRVLEAAGWFAGRRVSW